MTHAQSGIDGERTVAVESRGRRLLRLCVYAALILGLGFAVRSLPLRAAAAAAMMEARPAWLAIAILINLVLLPLWATQWRLLVPPAERIGWRRMLDLVALTWSAQNTLTSLGGGASAIVLLVVRGGLSRRTALSLYALDQVLTGIAKFAIVGAALFLVRLPLPVWRAAESLSLLIAIGILALSVAVLAGNRLAKIFPRRLSRRLIALAGLVHTEAVAFASLLHKACGWPLVLAFAKKLTEAAAALAIQKACGIPLSLEAAILITAAVSLATIIPSPPAFLGVFEVSVVFVYSFLGVPPALGLTAALLQHAAFLVPALGCGYFVLLRRPLHAAPVSSTARE